MKIFFPFTVKDIGGTATFARNFSDAIAEKNINFSNKLSLDFDILFIIVDCSLWYPIIAKILRKKIVQRLDGVYHPATPAGRWYPLYNLKMQIIHNFFADAVIYQSEFSKLSCEKFLGKTHAKQRTIIYNGVDATKISARNIADINNAPTKLLTFAKFRRQDQIKPIIESVKLLDSKKFTLDIYGSYTENLNHLFENLPSHIQFQGKKSNKELLQILHQYDIFLFSDQSACPNSLLEAMAARLPIIAFNRGSIPELIESGYNGEIIAMEKHNPFKQAYPFSTESYHRFSRGIEKINSHFKTYQEHTRELVIKKFSLQEMFTMYMKIIQS